MEGIMQDDQEYLDIVDDLDRVIGVLPRTEVYSQGLSCYRVINVFVRNAAGLLWIPRRSQSKNLFPGGLDVGVGGHVKSGESYDEAFFREVYEELNVSPSSTEYRVLGNLSPKADRVSSFMRVYELHYSGEPPYEPKEFCESWWLTPHEALLMVAHETVRPKDDLVPLLQRFYRAQRARCSP
jgi:isopentenyl-diphosphate delta-isomerase